MKQVTREQKIAHDTAMTKIIVDESRRKHPDAYVRSYVERFILPHVAEGKKEET